MNARQEAVTLMDELSEVQIKKVVDFMRIIREEKEETRSSGKPNLAGELFGILGKGIWAEYDTDLDWRRFDS